MKEKLSYLDIVEVLVTGVLLVCFGCLIFTYQGARRDRPGILVAKAREQATSEAGQVPHRQPAATNKASAKPVVTSLSRTGPIQLSYGVSLHAAANDELSQAESRANLSFSLGDTAALFDAPQVDMTTSRAASDLHASAGQKPLRW